MQKKTFDSIGFELLKMQFEGLIDAAERIRAEGIAAGQLGLLTWEKYIAALLRAREQDAQKGQKRQNKNNTNKEPC